MLILKILVETSARHIHITENDLKKLFGQDAELTKKKDLSQPGQFSCMERVTLVGPKGEIPGVSILGPVRSRTQVEISLTDARKIGLNAKIRESGHIDGTSGCKVKGPNGEIELECGVIAAKRHIHLTPDDANKFGVKNHQVVSVRVKTDERSLIFEDVVVRVSDKFAAAMHIDTDESNAAGIHGTVYGEIIL